MKKIIIPTILTATILIAGMFAMMPIEKASTVHTTVITQTGLSKTAVFTDADWDTAAQTAGDEAKRLTCTAAARIYEINFDIDGTVAAGTDINLTINPDGATATFGATTQVDIFAGVAPADEASLLTTRGLHQGATVDATGFIQLVLTADTQNNDEVVDLIAYYTSTGTCTFASSAA